MMSDDLVAINLLGSKLAVTSLEPLCRYILSLATRRTPAFVCFATAHMIVAATQQAEIRAAYQNAIAVSPDGVPVAWALRLLGHPQANCVSGPVSFPLLLEEAAKAGISVGFYGGRPGTLALIRSRIAREQPALRVAYCCSPPFRPLSCEEQQKHLEEIQSSQVQLLFVGLGSPTQECWMNRYSPLLNCVCLGVGGAFEFHSGEKVLPPLWLQRIGLTWLVRLAQEPRRLLRRNLYSPVFVALTLYWLALTPGRRRSWEAELDRSFAVGEVAAEAATQ